jgi:hypothetical protein
LKLEYHIVIAKLKTDNIVDFLSFGILEIIKLFQKVIIYQNISEFKISHIIAKIIQKNANNIDAVKLNKRKIIKIFLLFSLLLIFLNI